MNAVCLMFWLLIAVVMWPLPRLCMQLPLLLVGPGRPTLLYLHCLQWMNLRRALSMIQRHSVLLGTVASGILGIECLL